MPKRNPNPMFRLILAVLLMLQSAVALAAPPTANSDSVSTPEDTPLPITLTATDPDGHPLVYLIVTAPTNGVLSGAPPNVLYTPNPDFSGADSFQFRVSDGVNVSNIALVKIDVTPVNDPPVADPKNASTPEETPVGITLSGSDPEGTPLTFAVGPATGGTVSGTPPNVTFTPAMDFNGPASFTYTAKDDVQSSAPALVTINVTPVNDPPVADDQTVGALEDIPTPIVLTGSDIDGPSATYSIVSGPGAGSLSGTPPSVTYTSSLNYNGPDSFTFKINDGIADSNVATVTINVAPQNDPPVASDQNTGTDEDTPVSIVLAASDIDGDPLAYSVVTGPGDGALSGTAPNLTYTPNADFNGTDSFTFKANDGTVDSNVATVTINVAAVDDPPVADDQSVTTDEDVAASITLTGSDTEGAALSFSIVTDPASGVLSGAAPNVVYTPDLNFNGADSFTFLVNDGNSDSNVATVSITVNPVNDPPVADDQNLSTDEDVVLPITLTATDVDGDPLTYTVVSGPGNGTLSGATPNLTYTPDLNFNGADSFTFIANDGTVDSNLATVSITVGPVNDPPVADDVNVSTAEDTPVPVVLSGTDVEGDPLSYTVLAPPGAGVIGGSPPNLTYTPNQDFNGSDSFQYIANDGTDDSAPAMVSITVTPVNDTPDLVNPVGTLNVDEDSADITIDLATVFDDVDILTNSDVLTFDAPTVTNATLFDVVDVTDSTLTLSLAPDQNGTSDITITATDLAGEVATDIFTVNVAPVSDEPIANDDSASMNEDDAELVIDVLDNDTSVDGPLDVVGAGVKVTIDGVEYKNSTESDPTTVVNELGDAVTLPNGTVTIENNRIVYQPKADFFGTDFFTYEIEDPDGDRATATVTVAVVSQNDPPFSTLGGVIYKTVEENGLLIVPVDDGVLRDGAAYYDVDGKLLDGDGNEVGATVTANLVAPPIHALDFAFDSVTGAYEYQPAIGYVGPDSFSYRLYDGQNESTETYVVEIDVEPLPPPPPPTAPGQVSQFYNMSNNPLENIASVPANVLVVMDDSGSMDWNLAVTDTGDGGLSVTNAPISARKASQTSYTYLYDLATNTYPPTSSFGKVLPTQEAVDDEGDLDGNDYGVWRGRSHKYNNIYYNPEITYTPWEGVDPRNEEFADSDPRAARLDPMNPGLVVDLTQTISFRSTDVPVWLRRGGTMSLDNNDFYVPMYYDTSATPPLAYDDPWTRIDIVDGGGQLAGGLFRGGPNRTDCAGDGDPTSCTFEQELQNFANWFTYYRTREYVTKAGIGGVVAGVQNLRVGYDTISATTSEEIRDMNEDPKTGNKRLLMDNIYSVNSFGGTPLRQALARAGKTFGCETGSYCPVLPAPDGYCQQNFTLLFSDGYWNGGTGVSENTDIDGAGPFDGGRYEDNVSQTLGDVAMQYYENDIQPTLVDLVPVSNRDIAGAPPGTFADTDAVMHQHMKTYAIGFGVNGIIDPLSVPANPVTSFSWTDPFDGSLEKIDDMVHAAINGRGAYYSASNPTQLRAAFEAAFMEFSESASSVSAATFSSTSLQDGTVLYRGFFDLRDNTGDLTATTVQSDGTLAATPLWHAADLLNVRAPASRVIVTYDPLNNTGIPFRHGSLNANQQAMLSPIELSYLRGDRSNELPGGTLRERPADRGILGDIINSNPSFVGAPRAVNRDQAPFPTTDLYSDFASARANRQGIVYVGANDGMLHGFNGETGEEMFAFVPNKIIDETAKYRNRMEDLTLPSYYHQYFVDGSPRLNDAYVRASNGAASRSWNTVLVGGIGGGGKGYYALNVTDPTAFGNETTASNAVMWEFTEADDTYPRDLNGNPVGGAVGAWLDPNGDPVKDLGFALTQPSTVMTNVEDGSGNKEWMAVFGNGYNSTSGIATLIALKIDGGLDGWDPGDVIKVTTGVGVPGGLAPRAGFPNALGTPALVDQDLNGTADLAYAGDLLGNLYRFDISDPNPANWTATRLFTATYFDGVTDVPQPITVQPLVTKHPTEAGFMVVFGTGSFVTKEDGVSEEIQSIYGIWDRGDSSPATAASDSKALRLVEQVVTNVVEEVNGETITRRVITRNPVNYAPESGTPGTFGWYIDLDMPRATQTVNGNPNPDTSGYAPPDPQYPGERAIRRLILRDGVIVTTTVLPATGDSSCFGALPGAIMLFDLLDGTDPDFPVVDFNNDGYIDGGDLVPVGGEAYAGGVVFNRDDLDGTLVDLSTLGGEGDTDYLFVSGGDETISYQIIDLNDSRTGRLSWRELDEMN